MSELPSAEEFASLLDMAEAVRELNIKVIGEALEEGKTPVEIAHTIFMNLVQSPSFVLAGALTGFLVQMGIEGHAAEIAEAELSNDDDDPLKED